MSSNHLTNKVPELRRVQKCATCAFNPGTEANQSHTPIKAKLCAEIPEAFLCHEETEEICCAGWSDLTERLLQEGYYERQSDFQRERNRQVEQLAVARIGR